MIVLSKTKTDSDFLLEKVKKIHMIGIGGAGMFPIAEILHSRGYILTGSDNNESDILARVRALGIKVTLGHFAENVEGAELVIYSAAIMKDNAELVSANEKGIPIMERALALGAITRKYNNVIGVCGTHGKTTVTSMITQILVQANLDPTAVIGGRLPLIDGYGRAGNSELMVCEACEFVDTFLQLSPDIAVLLNIDNDHLDYFKTVENLILSFTKFSNMASTIIVNGDDEKAMQAVDGLDKKMITFGYHQNNDYVIENVIAAEKTAGEFDLVLKGEIVAHIVLSVPGKHNIMNAAAAAVAGFEAGAERTGLEKSLFEFKGAGRRFEVLGVVDGITIVDDYAHHPTELEVTLTAAMGMGYNKVYAIFQPFTFSRTSTLLDDFARVLEMPDQTVLSEIMGSREINTYGITTNDLCEKIDGAVWFDSFEKIADYIVDNAKAGDLVITLGCGDIYKAAKMFLKKLE